jgi:hypothetical protein
MGWRNWVRPDSVGEGAVAILVRGA